MEPELLRIEEVAHLLGMSRSTAYALVASGELPTVRLGRSVRVRRSTLEAWVQRLPEGGHASADDRTSSEPTSDGRSE